MQIRRWLALLALTAVGCDQAPEPADQPGVEEISREIWSGAAVSKADCSEARPTSAPPNKTYDCTFEAVEGSERKKCRIKMELQPDDHFAVWKQVQLLNPATGQYEKTLSCAETSAKMKG